MSMTALPDPMPLSDLLALPEPKARYVVAPLIPQEGITLLAGSPGSFKTWMGAESTVSIARGWPLLGKFVVAAPQKVLFMEFEMGAQSLRLRFAGVDPSLPIKFIIDQTMDFYDPDTLLWLAGL